MRKPISTQHATRRNTQHTLPYLSFVTHHLFSQLKQGVNITLLLVTLLAAVLRLWKLGEWSLWEDEILTTLDAQRFPEFFPINPISYIFVKLSMYLFGSSEWGVRLVPCLVSIITVPVLYFLVRRIYNSKTALLTALLTTLSPWHLFWSQNARSYIFTFLFASIAAFLFYLALEKDSIVLIVFSLVSTLLLIMSHLLSGMLITAFAGYILILWLLPVENPPGLRIRNIAVFFAPFLVASTLLLVPDFFQYLTSGWGHNVWSRSPVYVTFTLVYELTIPVLVVAFISALYIIVTFFQKNQKTSNQQHTNRNIIFLACYAGIPFVLFLLSSTFMNVAGYYMFFTLPAYLTLASIGITESYIAPFRSHVKLGLFLIIILTLFSRDYLYFQTENGGRTKWREALTDVKQMMASNDVIVSPIPKITEYYLPFAETAKLKKVIKSKEEFRANLKSTNRSAWFVLDCPTISTVNQGRQFTNWLNNEAQFINRYSCYARVMDRSIIVYKLE